MVEYSVGEHSGKSLKSNNTNGTKTQDTYKKKDEDITKSETVVSLLLVQMPGISLGVFGIMKAIKNHGTSKQAAKDALR